MTDQWDWWRNLLAERMADGRKDANDGVFEPPYPNSDDPQDEDENAAYKRGFKARMVMLTEDQAQHLLNCCSVESFLRPCGFDPRPRHS